MNRLSRAGALLAAAAVLIGASGCESNNVGKLEDTKWGSAYVPDYKGISARGVTMTLTFHADGRFLMGVKGPAANMNIVGQWKLGSWDNVSLYNLSPPLAGASSHTEKITISGDTLTMADSDGTKVVFTKIDNDMLKANAQPTKVQQTPASPNAKPNEKDKPTPVWQHPDERRVEPLGAYK